MVIIIYTDNFKKKFKKIIHQEFKLKIKKQIHKIILNPETGKPMRKQRKGTREVYIKPYRLSYANIEDRIIFLDIYHKDKQ